jgi:hypothetical protein
MAVHEDALNPAATSQVEPGQAPGEGFAGYIGT